jgi:hypothetical protein
MTDLVRLYAQIALLRRGPQDVPGSTAVLIITVLGYFLVNLVFASVFPPIRGPWFPHLLVDIVFMLVWFAVLLKLVGKPERFIQTASAVYGYQAVLAPITIITAWLFSQHGQSPDPTWQFAVTLIALAPVFWIIAVGSAVLKAALEWSRPACVMLMIAQILAGQLLMVALFPIPR